MADEIESVKITLLPEIHDITGAKAYVVGSDGGDYQADLGAFIPTKTSELTNDSEFVSGDTTELEHYYTKEQADQQNKDLEDALKDKQDTLVSGENIKNINGQSVVGSGNIEINPEPDPAKVVMIDGDQTINNVKTFANPPKCDQQPAADDDLINLQWTRHYIAEVGDPILEKVETLEKDMEGTLENASANNFTQQLLNGALRFMGVANGGTDSVIFYDKDNNAFLVIKAGSSQFGRTGSETVLVSKASDLLHNREGDGSFPIWDAYNLPIATVNELKALITGALKNASANNYATQALNGHLRFMGGAANSEYTIFADINNAPFIQINTGGRWFGSYNRLLGLISKEGDIIHRKYTTQDVYNDYNLWDAFNLPNPASQDDLNNYWKASTSEGSIASVDELDTFVARKSGVYYVINSNDYKQLTVFRNNQGASASALEIYNDYMLNILKVRTTIQGDRYSPFYDIWTSKSLPNPATKEDLKNYARNTRATKFQTTETLHSEITTAQFIAFLKEQGAFDGSGYWSTMGTWKFADNDVITDTGCGDVTLAGAYVELLSMSETEYDIRISTAPSRGGDENAITNAVFICRVRSGIPLKWERLANISSVDDALKDKQDTLVSGQNIKTINGQSVVGSGDLVLDVGLNNAFKVVSALPATGDPKYIYLLPKSESESNDSYYEYIWLEDYSRWERIGSTQIDLSDYYTTTQADARYVRLDPTAQTITGIKTFASLPIVPTVEPSADGQVVSRAWLNKKVQPIQTAVTSLQGDVGDMKPTVTKHSADISSLNTSVSQLETEVAAKQDTLVSGENIKTINGQSILGAGNIEISGGGSSWNVVEIEVETGQPVPAVNVTGSTIFRAIGSAVNNSLTFNIENPSDMGTSLLKAGESFKVVCYAVIDVTFNAENIGSRMFDLDWESQSGAGTGSESYMEYEVTYTGQELLFKRRRFTYANE